MRLMYYHNEVVVRYERRDAVAYILSGWLWFSVENPSQKIYTNKTVFNSRHRDVSDPSETRVLQAAADQKWMGLPPVASAASLTASERVGCP